MILSRRRFFGLLAAPAIVHIGNLMPVKAMEHERVWIEDAFWEWFEWPRTSIPAGAWRMFSQDIPAALYEAAAKEHFGEFARC